MNINQLNCTACGAPISVPDDVDHINCASCGSFLSVQRGEGYVALKMVEKVAQVIQDSSYVTQTELKKLQFSQEISMLEMQLNSIQGEIRGLMRAAPQTRITQQIQELHFNEYTLLDRLRLLHLKRALVDKADPENDVETLQSQLSFLKNELTVLNLSAAKHPQVRKILIDLEQEHRRLAEKLHNLKVYELKRRLESYQPFPESRVSLEAVQAELSAVEKDIRSLSAAQPGSPENTVVLQDLKQRHAALIHRWKEFENKRIASALSPVSLSQPFSSDLAVAHSQLTQIQNDLQMLGSWEVNSEVKQHLAQLLKKEKALNRHVKKLEKAALASAKGSGKASAMGGVAGVGLLSALGLGALFGSIGTQLSRLTSRSSQSNEDVLTPAQNKTSDRTESTVDEELFETPTGEEPVPFVNNGSFKTGPVFLKGCGLALVPLVMMFCLSFGVYAAYSEVNPDSARTVGIGLFFLGSWIGYIVGTWLFFRVLNRVPFEIRSKQRIWRAVLAGAAAIYGAFHLLLSIYAFLDPESAAAEVVILAIVSLTPLLGLVFFFYQLLPDAWVWKPVHKLFARS